MALGRKPASPGDYISVDEEIGDDNPDLLMNRGTLIIPRQVAAEGLAFYARMPEHNPVLSQLGNIFSILHYRQC